MGRKGLTDRIREAGKDILKLLDDSSDIIKRMIVEKKNLKTPFEEQEVISNTDNNIAQDRGTVGSASGQCWDSIGSGSGHRPYIVVVVF